MSTVRVLTLNIWNREGRWPKRRQLLRHWLDRLRPDLIAIQEAKDSDQLGELFGPNYHAEWTGNEQGGIAVVSRWALDDRTEYSLQGDGDQAGGIALRVRAAAPRGPISFCCATSFFYLPHHGIKRERQMPGLAKFAREGVGRDDFPPILAGDFNAPDESSEIRYLKGLQSVDGSSAYFVDAWAFAGEGDGATWSRTNDFARESLLPSRRIDYIFVGHPRMSDGAGHVESCAVVCNERVDEVWPSDHFGVFAELHA